MMAAGGLVAALTVRAEMPNKSPVAVSVTTRGTTPTFSFTVLSARPEACLTRTSQTI
jgi:hypothetical protein